MLFNIIGAIVLAFCIYRIADALNYFTEESL